LLFTALILEDDFTATNDKPDPDTFSSKNSVFCYQAGTGMSTTAVVFLILCSLGVFLRIWQYWANPSLWLDEAMLANNIVNRSFVGLTRPLDANQGAPIGFLFIQKVFIELFGNQDYVLRLFPLLTSILAIPLMWRVAQAYVGRWPSLLALSFFAISAPLIYFASEVKQYSSDVFCTLLVLVVTPKALDVHATSRAFMLFGFVSSIVIWFSHPIVFIIAGVFLVLILDIVKSKEFRVRGHKLFWFAEAAALCIVSFFVLFLISLRFLTANAELLDYWQDAFLPMPPWKDVSWFLKAWYGLLNSMLGLYLVSSTHAIANFALAGVATLLFIAGGILLFCKRWQFALVLTMPFFFASLASGMGKYPFAGRLMVFSIPLLILLIANGVEGTRSFLLRIGPRTAICATAVLIVLLLFKPIVVAWENFSQPPLKEHIKPIMSYVNQNRLTPDIVYIYYGALPAFKYYASRYGFRQGDYIEGIASRKDPEKYLNDIDRFRNHERVWFIFAHICRSCRVDEENFFLQHLDTVGARLAAFTSEGASVYLYDLTGRNPGTSRVLR
jgi:Dolichyl-phosphate-mannose-protein mannosyltransferase